MQEKSPLADIWRRFLPEIKKRLTNSRICDIIGISRNFSCRSALSRERILMQTSTFYTAASIVGGRTVPVLKSRLLSVPHGFSLRAGGDSTLPHLAALNLSYDVGEASSVVDRNRTLFFSAALGRETRPELVISAKQIHSATVRHVTEADLRRTDFELDGFVTDRPGVALMVKTADCCPLLFCDEKHGVIGAAHAGWRGSVAGIAAETVKAMCRRGARPEDICCAIGPSIHACCYEVGEDFVETVRSLLPAAWANACLFRDQNGRYHADLIEINRAFLAESGVLPAHLDICGECTCCRPDLFFSHRASRGKRGLMGAVISL